MSEFIVIQVGQCGNQIGSEFWPRVLQEHGILCKNQKMQQKKNYSGKQLEFSKAFHSFFSVPSTATECSFKTISDLEKGKVKARAICIDMEDSVVAHYRKGPMRNIFDETCLVTNYPGSGNNWAEGNLTHGKKYAQKIENLLRKSAECCDQLHGFLLLFSVGGGTGSGLGSSLLPLLSDVFPNVQRMVTCIYPANSDDVITAPYNAALATQVLTDHADCVFPVENQALIDICSRLRRCQDKEIAQKVVKSKPFQDMNDVIVHMLLNLTSGARFPGSLNVDMSDIPNNMVPFPGLHYICSGIAPLGNVVRKEELFPSAWSKDNQLLKMDPMSGLTMASLLLGRGGVSLADLRASIDSYQKKVKIAPWSQDTIKAGLCSVAPAYYSASVLGLFNTSSMASLFQTVLTKFKKLYNRKAHTHHYLQVNGFDDSYFLSSLESLQNSAADYRKVLHQETVKIPRLNVL